MRYSVTWTRTATAQPATLWMRSSNRQGITDAAHRIELELRNDAEKKGIEWWPFRAYSDDPLAVLFSVHPADCRVWIVQVRETA